MGLLTGKVVVITGAGAGLGRAYALDLARRGARVLVDDVAVDAGGVPLAERVAAAIRDAGGEAVACAASVDSVEGGAAVVRAAVDAFGRLDALVNNAGITRDATLLDVRPEDWDAVLRVNLLGTLACTQAAAWQMIEQGDGGAIVNTTSPSGLRGNLGQSSYAASKGGVYALTLCHALELSRHGIRVNAIAPLARTAMAEGSVVPAAYRPEQVAPLVAFLVSPLADGVTGQVFGAQGEHLFAYRMAATPGVRQPAGFTPEEIAARLGDITRPVEAAPAPRSEAAPAGSAAARVQGLFRHLHAGFRPRRARDWRAEVVWQVEGAGAFAVRIEGGRLEVAAGPGERPTCEVRTDAETLLAVAEGRLAGEEAFLEGRIQASNLADLMKYQRVVDAARALAAADAAAGGEAGEGG